MSGAVYFIRSGGSPIKIGYSTNVPKRVARMNTFYHTSIEVLATVPSNRRGEKFFHEKLAAHRLSGEWFDPCPEVLAVVEMVRREDAACLPSGCEPPSPKDKSREKVLKRGIVMACRAFIEGLAYPLGIDETREAALRRVAADTDLPYRTLKSIWYENDRNIFAYVESTLRAEFVRKFRAIAGPDNAAVVAAEALVRESKD